MLKRYYSIEEAAKHLTITRMDVMVLAARGDIRLCAWFNENLCCYTTPFPELEPGDYHICGDGYAFKGYIQIPFEMINPNSKKISFYPMVIIEAVTPLNDHLPMKIDPPGFFVSSSYVEGLDEYRPSTLTVDCNDAVIPTQDLMNLSPNKQDTVKQQMENLHKSNQLAMLNQASCHFWAKADREDAGTHPKNEQVVAWLVERDFTKTLAEKAATIIRPEWAPKGRKPEE